MVFLGLAVVYLALAWKNPFKTNSLIPNLEPSPDTFYYSIPAWNFIHGQGFSMKVYGIEVPKGVPPLYGILLMPFFKIWRDVRSYFYLNIVLGVLSIGLTLMVVFKFYETSKLKTVTGFLAGLILVTNFYFYNLPTLMMAENIQIPLVLISVLLILNDLGAANIIGTVVVAGLLWFSKLSNFPIILCLFFWLLIKFLRIKFWQKISGRYLILLTGIVVLSFGFLLIKVIIPYLPSLIAGNEWFSIEFSKKFLGFYLSQFLGRNGHYLWYFNQQIESVAGFLSLIGMGIGLFWKKYRSKVLIIGSIILSIVVFHSFMYYPEGRYISVVIPVYIVAIGLVVELLSKIKTGQLAAVVIILSYLLVRQNINGFNERKLTSLKRQVLNNRLEDNEKPWNYLAVLNFNKYFQTKKDNLYLGTFLSPFYLGYFGNGNYKYLPGTMHQDFMGDGRGFGNKYFPNGMNEDLPGYYEKLLKNGNEIYISNFYSNANRSWEEDWRMMQSRFKMKEVADGCYGWCKIYKVEVKKNK